MHRQILRQKLYRTLFCDPTLSTLSTTCRFSLIKLPFRTIKDHVRRNAGIVLPDSFGRCPWYYLSGFYYNDPRSIRSPGYATRILKSAIASIGEPIALCCEPVLGTDPRSITAKNEHMDPEHRYTALCDYYRTKFGMHAELAIDCTLRTELTGHGKRWSSADRKFMWSLPLHQYSFHSAMRPMSATLDGSTMPFDHPYAAGAAAAAGLQ